MWCKFPSTVNVAVKSNDSINAWLLASTRSGNGGAGVAFLVQFKTLKIEVLIVYRLPFMVG